MMRATPRGSGPRGTPRQASGAAPTRGFTLVELLVVIVVIGILAAIAVPVFLSQADKASDASLKSDLTSAAKLLQVSEANGEPLPSEITAGQSVDLGTAGTFTSNQTLAVSGSGETLCVEGTSDSGTTYSADLENGVRDYTCAGIRSGLLVTDGLFLHFDASNPATYPGSGDLVQDLISPTKQGRFWNGSSFNTQSAESITFDGVNEYLTFPREVSQEYAWTPSGVGSNTLVLDLWVKPDRSGGFLISRPWNGGGEYNYTVSCSRVGVRVNESGSLSYPTNTCISNEWMNLVTTITPTDIYVHKNGTLFAGPTPHGITSNEPGLAKNDFSVTLMTLYPYGSSWTGSGSTAWHAAEGQVGAFKMYNRELSPAEIQQNFGAVRDRYGV